MQHPIDRLSEIRAEIRRLQQEAREIRRQLFDGSVGNRGEHYSANVVRHIVLKLIPPRHD